MTKTPLLEVEKLTVQRSGRRLLDQIDLSVPHGSIHAIVGSNGAGKTTLVRACLGQIGFEGRVEFHWRAEGRLGYVPQRIDVVPGTPLTAIEFLALPLQRRPIGLGIRRDVRGRAEEALERLDLTEVTDRHVGALSGGELRRLLLAQSILPRPEFLVLDEPAAGVDFRALETVESVLTELRDQHGVGILIVTHDLDQVVRLADAVTGLHQSVRFQGPPSEVLTAEAMLRAFRPRRDDS